MVLSKYARFQDRRRDYNRHGDRPIRFVGKFPNLIDYDETPELSGDRRFDRNEAFLPNNFREWGMERYQARTSSTQSGRLPFSEIYELAMTWLANRSSQAMLREQYLEYRQQVRRQCPNQRQRYLDRLENVQQWRNRDVLEEFLQSAEQLIEDGDDERAVMHLFAALDILTAVVALLGQETNPDRFLYQEVSQMARRYAPLMSLTNSSSLHELLLMIYKLGRRGYIDPREAELLQEGLDARDREDLIFEAYERYLLDGDDGLLRLMGRDGINARRQLPRYGVEGDRARRLRGADHRANPLAMNLRQSPRRLLR